MDKILGDPELDEVLDHGDIYEFLEWLAEQADKS